MNGGIWLYMNLSTSPAKVLVGFYFGNNVIYGKCESPYKVRNTVYESRFDSAWRYIVTMFNKDAIFAWFYFVSQINKPEFNRSSSSFDLYIHFKLRF